jgi:hypothetical protein
MQWTHGTCWQIWQTEQTKRAQNLNTGYFATDFSDPAAVMANPGAYLPYGKDLVLDVCPNPDCPIKFVQMSGGCSDMRCLCNTSFSYTGIRCNTPRKTLHVVIAGLGWDGEIEGKGHVSDLISLAFRNRHCAVFKKLLPRRPEMCTKPFLTGVALETDEMADCAVHCLRLAGTPQDIALYSTLLTNVRRLNNFESSEYHRFIKFFLENPLFIHLAYYYRHEIWNVFSLITGVAGIQYLINTNFPTPTFSITNKISSNQLRKLCNYDVILPSVLILNILRRIHDGAGCIYKWVFNMVECFRHRPGYFAAIVACVGSDIAPVETCATLARLTPDLYENFEFYVAIAETAVSNTLAAKQLICHLAPSPPPPAAVKRTYCEMEGAEPPSNPPQS